MFTAKIRSAAIVAGLIILGIIAAFILYFFQIFNRSDHFLPGVTIAGISVSGYTEEEAAAAVQQSLNKAYDTKITFYKDDYTYTTTLGFISEPVEADTLVKKFWKQERMRDWKRKVLNMDGAREVSYPINIKYNKTRRAEMVREWADYLQVDPENAKLEMDSVRGLMVIPGRIGRIINQGTTLRKLPQRWQDVDHDINIAIILDERPPAVDEESLSNMGQLSTFSTWYNSGEVDRSHNLSKAAAKINTSVVLPGKVFSFNHTVGQRIVENGYRDAMVIVNGKFVPGLGGGICQVSSTLYNACLLAGLKIVERHNHALAVAYVPLGRDATVAYGAQDFRFQNNTSSPVYIKSAASGGKLSITIYGNLDYKQKIGLSQVVDQVINFNTVYENDDSIPAGTQKVDHKGIPGYIVRSFRTYYDINGNTAKTEQLARDSYIPLNQIVFVGPAVAVTPPPGEVEQPPAEPPAGQVQPEPLPQDVIPIDNNSGGN